MIFRDIKEIKGLVSHINSKVNHLLQKESIAASEYDTDEDEPITIKDVFDEMHALNRLVKDLVNVCNPSNSLEIFNERIKKCDTMLNEFKGLMSMARASLQDKKDFQEALSEMKKAIRIMKKMAPKKSIHKAKAQESRSQARIE